MCHQQALPGQQVHPFLSTVLYLRGTRRTQHAESGAQRRARSTRVRGQMTTAQLPSSTLHGCRSFSSLLCVLSARSHLKNQRFINRFCRPPAPRVSLLALSGERGGKRAGGAVNRTAAPGSAREAPRGSSWRVHAHTAGLSHHDTSRF